MGTVAAVRLNPSMRAFYEPLRAAEKSPKIALTAWMRKFIVTVNAMLRAGSLMVGRKEETDKTHSGHYLDVIWSLWRSIDSESMENDLR